ncbi:MAG: glutamate racemase [Bacteroidetes bacterium]|nr:glutamate racemase [Bacteroidota bacterium]
MKTNSLVKGPIGIFDSGFGGLTILKELVKQIPQYDYIYLGDNARAPYGNRSYQVVTNYTTQCVKALFDLGCNLVILACNTASAKALRTIQQQYLPENFPTKKVLGVLRPTTEIVGNYSKTGNVGILGTSGTISSMSYPIEINHFSPHINVFQQACPMWVPLIENNEHNDNGADYFVKKYLDLLFEQSADIDTIILACTHYPLLIKKIKKYIPAGVKLISQNKIVANSLSNYLYRHPEIEKYCSKNAEIKFYTSDDCLSFDFTANTFFGKKVKSKHLEII